MEPNVRKSTRIRDQVLKMEPARVVALLVDFFGVSQEKPTFEDHKMFERLFKQLRPRNASVEPDVPFLLRRKGVVEKEKDSNGPEMITKQSRRKSNTPQKIPTTTEQSNEVIDLASSESIDSGGDSDEDNDGGDGDGFSYDNDVDDDDDETNTVPNENPIEKIQVLPKNLHSKNPSSQLQKEKDFAGLDPSSSSQIVQVSMDTTQFHPLLDHDYNGEPSNSSVDATRKRGRPNKSLEPKPKSKRGRPRKVAEDILNVDAEELPEEAAEGIREPVLEPKPKRKRGRPRKDGNLLMGAQQNPEFGRSDTVNLSNDAQNKNPSIVAQNQNPSEDTSVVITSNDAQNQNPSIGAQNQNPSEDTSTVITSNDAQNQNPSEGTSTVITSNGAQNQNPSEGTSTVITSNGAQKQNPSGDDFSILNPSADAQLQNPLEGSSTVNSSSDIPIIDLTDDSITVDSPAQPQNPSKGYSLRNSVTIPSPPKPIPRPPKPRQKYNLNPNHVRKPRPRPDPKLSIAYKPGDSSSDDELETRYCNDPNDKDYAVPSWVLQDREPEEPERDELEGMDMDRLERAYRFWTKQSPLAKLKIADLTVRPTDTLNPPRLNWETVANRYQSLEMTSERILLLYHARLLTDGAPVTRKLIEDLAEKRFNEAVARGEVLLFKNIRDIVLQVRKEVDPNGRARHLKPVTKAWVETFKRKKGIKLLQLFPLKTLYPRVPGSIMWKVEQRKKARLEREEKKATEDAAAVAAAAARNLELLLVNPPPPAQVNPLPTQVNIPEFQQQSILVSNPQIFRQDIHDYSQNPLQNVNLQAANFSTTNASLSPSSSSSSFINHDLNNQIQISYQLQNAHAQQVATAYQPQAHAQQMSYQYQAANNPNNAQEYLYLFDHNGQIV